MVAEGLRRWWRRVRQADQRPDSDDVQLLEERTQDNELRIQALEESVHVLEIRHGFTHRREAS